MAVERLDPEAIEVAVHHLCFMCQTSKPVWREEDGQDYAHWHHEDFGERCRANSYRNWLRGTSRGQP